MTRLHYRLLCQDPLIYSIHVRFKNLGDGISNIYLIHDEDEWLMIDAGAPGEQSYGIITRALQEIGVDMSKLKLFLTHQHFDHSGQVNNILLPHTPIYGAAIGFESRRPPLAQNINELFFRRMLAMGSSLKMHKAMKRAIVRLSLLMRHALILSRYQKGMSSP